MKINKKVKVVLLSLLGIFLLFFIILVYHIATAKPIQYDNANIQISRIDFSMPLDTLKAKQAHQILKKMDGVINPKLYKDKGVIVYFHDNRIADSKKVFDKMMESGTFDAKRFILPANLANKQVCPVMNQDGFSYKFSKFIQNVFN